ncbi:MAG: SCO family protein [Hyphomonadaceae bacterium]
MSEPTPNPKPRDRTSLGGFLTIATVSALIAGGGAYYFLGQNQPAQEARLEQTPAGCVLNPPARIGGPISLIDQTGARVTQANYAGHPTLIYFGFTHCPDICPTAMYLVGESLPLMGEAGASVHTALVTVDPDRDTPDQLASYITTDGFPPRLTGLTGNQDEIAAAARAFAVNYQRQGEGADYTMSHTSFVYLMSPDWHPLAMMSTIGRTPQQLAACLSQGLAAQSTGGT